MRSAIEGNAGSLVSTFRSISRLEAENAALRRQLIVLRRQVRGRVQFTNSDRLFFIQLYRWYPSVLTLDVAGVANVDRNYLQADRWRHRLD